MTDTVKAGKPGRCGFLSAITAIAALGGLLLSACLEDHPILSGSDIYDAKPLLRGDSALNGLDSVEIQLKDPAEAWMLRLWGGPPDSLERAPRFLSDKSGSLIMIVRGFSRDAGHCMTETFAPGKPVTLVDSCPRGTGSGSLVVLSQSPKQDTTVGIGDSVSFRALFGGGRRPLNYSWIWNSPGKADSSAGTLSSGSAFQVTLPFNLPGTYTFSLQVVSDTSHFISVWRIKVVNSLLKVDAGRDTTILSTDTLWLSGRPAATNGSILKSEWKIGDGPFRAVSSGDTSIQASQLEAVKHPDSVSVLMPIPCIFRVTDILGNVAEDTIRISILFSKDASLAGLKTSEGALEPAFNPFVTSYRIKVPHATASVILKAAAESGSASIEWPQSQGFKFAESTLVYLHDGANSAPLRVRAEDPRFGSLIDIVILRDTLP
ncbi:MAG: autotransporter protein [Fibrobacteres bacterium]|nr:autotransporter protein [Fibrobacterota bacterium]